MPQNKKSSVSFSSKDFLSESVPKKVTKKRKLPAKDASAIVSKKPKKSVQGNETRGHMTIFFKSNASVEKDLKERKEKNKDAAEPTAAAKSLSVTVKDGETLLAIDGDVVMSHLLTEQEKKELETKKTFAKKKYGDEPRIFKLQWRDRDSATLIGIVVEKKTNFDLVSKLTEVQSFSVSNSVWFASQESVADIALREIDGKKDLLAVVPDYKGVVRVSLDGDASGAFGLTLK